MFIFAQCFADSSNMKSGDCQYMCSFCAEIHWQEAACPPGVKIPIGSLSPPGGKNSRGIFTPTLGILIPGGENTPARVSCTRLIRFAFYENNFNDK